MNSTPPKFEYPAADAREFWVPCEKDDPKRGEYLSCHGVWYTGPKTVICTNCGQHWRKKVAVPDGWELVEKSVPFQRGVGIEWISDWADQGSNQLDKAVGVPVGELANNGEYGNKGIICFIRRIPATVQPAPKADECDPNQIIALLIAAGFVTAQNVDEARKLLRKA
jgi:uncharacterized protein YbdZ (MbtH family)